MSAHSKDLGSTYVTSSLTPRSTSQPLTPNYLLPGYGMTSLKPEHTDQPLNDSEPSLEYRIQDDPGLEAANLLFSDRLRQQTNRVRLLNQQLMERQKIGQVHVDEIDKAMLKCDGYLASLNQIQFPFANPEVEHKRQLLARMLLDMEGQRRQEIVHSWADQASLQVDFLEAMADHDSSVRKYRLLSEW